MSATGPVPSTLAAKVALVTGGAHRVGKAIAMALAAHGARVAVHYNDAADEAEATVREIGATRNQAFAIGHDLREPSAPRALVDDVVAHFGSLDVVVNSAAVMWRTPVDDVTVEQWDAIFALNLRAPFFVAQAARPWLARAVDGGVIVNIADLAAFETWPAYVPHSVSKAGVVHLTRSLARAFAPDVRVNGVAPGAVLLPDDWDPATGNRLAATTPLGRLGSPEDVAGAVLFLVTAPYVTGETLIVDGGRHIRK